MTSDWCFEIAIVSLLTNTSNKLICRINYFSIVDRVILHSQLDIIIESMMHVLRWQWKQDVSSHKLEQFLWHRIISFHLWTFHHIDFKRNEKLGWTHAIYLYETRRKSNYLFIKFHRLENILCVWRVMHLHFKILLFDVRGMQCVSRLCN